MYPSLQFCVDYDDDWDMDDDPTMSDAMQKALECETITPDFNPSDAFCLLVNNDAFDFLGILAQNFYLRTNRIPKRDLNTLPLFTLFHNNEDSYCKEFNLIFFYNETLHQYFCGNNPFIKSYIAIDDPDIIDKIADLDTLVGKSIPDFIALFKDAKLEDRRVGFMFQFLKNWRKTSLEFKWPFIYQERNFNFTEQEIMDIKQSDFFTPSTDNKVEDSAIMKHAVADLIGFGDLRLRLTSLFVNKPDTKLRVGFELNLPTAFALKKGIIGGNFTNNCTRPSFNLFQFVDNVLTDSKRDCAIEEGIDLSLKAADRLSALILQTELGENKHVILGLIVEPYFKISHYLTLNSFLTISYIFPQRENRYFLRKKNCADFQKSTYESIIGPCCDGDPGVCDQTAAKEALIFFQEQILNTFFPDCAKTIVYPGFTFQYNAAATIDIRNWELMFGVDFWYKQQETLEPRCINKNNYYTCIAAANQCWQTKAYFRLLRIIEKRNYDFGVSITTDTTFASRGIGKDFSVGIGFDFHY